MSHSALTAGGTAGRVAAVAVLGALSAVLGLGVGTLGPAVGLVVPGLVLAATIVANPFWGLVLLLFTVPWEAVFLLPGGVTLTRLIGVGATAGWVLRKLMRRESWRTVVESNFTAVMVLFVAFAALSSFWARFGVPLGVLVRLAMLLVFALLVVDLANRWSRASSLAKALVAGALVAALMVIFQAQTTDVNRAGGGVAGSVNTTAIALISVVPFGVFLLRTGENIWWRSLGLVSVTASVIAVILTFSRASMLVLPIVLAFEFWESLRHGRSRLRLLAVTAVAAAVAVTVLPLDKVESRVDTIGPYLERTLNRRDPGYVNVSSRGVHIRVALAVFRDHPVVGVGIENFPQLYKEYQHYVPAGREFHTTARSPHGTFWGLLAELGLVGLALWLLVLGTGLWSAITAWRMLVSDRGSKEFQLVRAATISLSTMILFNAYTEVHFDKLLWLALGLVVCLRGLTEWPSQEERGPHRSQAGEAPRVVPGIAPIPPRDRKSLEGSSLL